MFQRIGKSITALLFVLAFLSPQIANLHMLDHIMDGDTPTVCEFYDIISTANQLDVFSGDPFSFDVDLQDVPSSYVVFTQYDVPHAKIASPTSVYNKPPPIS
ncbi:hypothetical protein POV27_17550 [Aureisphaera galaxeae]|uniref:hypothetical protein n=1 Tax=Aureisphaera galaxeae TaxID=1538023 RepID=UPI00234FE771|nr:hypothetical protein [Aureisphaera galaxeae]MDC8005863.1 hypothetical protein [Aureisphaera galaxeae]